MRSDLDFQFCHPQRVRSICPLSTPSPLFPIWLLSTHSSLLDPDTSYLRRIHHNPRSDIVLMAPHLTLGVDATASLTLTRNSRSNWLKSHAYSFGRSWFASHRLYHLKASGSYSLYPPFSKVATFPGVTRCGRRRRSLEGRTSRIKFT